METGSDGRAFVHEAFFEPELHDELREMRILIAGVGGVGNELLKNFALMGVGSGSRGGIVLSDDAVVQESHLPRSVLFGAKDLSRPKVEVAAERAKSINSAMNIDPRSVRVGGASSGSIFSDDFFSQLSAVCVALDGVPNRLILDERCLRAGVAMLDTGVDGTKASTQVTVPEESAPWGVGARDPPEREFQSCVLRNFPYSADHTTKWARDLFDGMFMARPQRVNSYLSDAGFVERLETQSAEARLGTLEELQDALCTFKPVRYEGCVEWARLQFEQHFANGARQLLHAFPQDSRSSAGEPFWQGMKRRPDPVIFDASDTLHMEFVTAAANLQAAVYGLNSGNASEDQFRHALDRVQVPPFAPKTRVAIATPEDPDARAGAGAGGEEDATAIDAARLTGLFREIKKDFVGFRLTEISFDSNDKEHAAFVHAASALRARSYRIPPHSRHEASNAAAGARPALVTTAALAAGLTSLQLYPLARKQAASEFRCWFANLALPRLVPAAPLAVERFVTKTAVGPLSWTVWSRINVDAVNLTLAEFLAKIESQVGLTVDMLTYGQSLLFMSFNPKDREKRLRMTLIELIANVAKVTLPGDQRFVTVSISAEDADGNDVSSLPDVRVRIRQD